MHLKRLIALTGPASMLFIAAAFAAAPDIVQLDRPGLTVDACYAPVMPVATIGAAESPALCLASMPSDICAPNLHRVVHQVAFAQTTGRPPTLSCTSAGASPPT